jgi:hypothetical protein
MNTRKSVEDLFMFVAVGILLLVNLWPMAMLVASSFCLLAMGLACRWWQPGVRVLVALLGLILAVLAALGLS